ncbi:MAG TPA: hypothetical protein VLA29_09915 [Acidimicrobiia bacterium]|nr:hypothetical protein [Acidimicrobiia bacterium]
MPESPATSPVADGFDVDYSDLSAVFINCTLKRSPELSHTGGLIDISEAVMSANGITTEIIPHAPRGGGSLEP